MLSTIALRVKSMPSRYRSNRAALDVGLTTEAVTYPTLQLTDKQSVICLSVSEWIFDSAGATRTSHGASSPLTGCHLCAPSAISTLDA